MATRKKESVKYVVQVDARAANLALDRLGRRVSELLDALGAVNDAIAALSTTPVGWNQNAIHVGARAPEREPKRGKKVRGL